MDETMVMPGTGSADFILALPTGTLLRGQYRIERVLGRPGGFGVTYLAEDVNLQRQVAIKEFLPRELAGRGADRTTVLPHSGQEQDLFEYGLSRFMEEGRLLAMLDDHPNVVRVRSAFPENGTAYLVMNYYEGETLSEAAERVGGKLPPAEAVKIIDQVLDGLTEAHGRGILHRDVKPENIYLRRAGDGTPEALLLDFGAARQAVKDKTGMTAVLTPGYAPLEQYSRAGDQGPWTDIYACAAVLYSLITGETPPAAPERIEDDPLKPPTELEPSCPLGVEQAVLRGLAMRRQDRPQSADEFRELLRQEVTPASTKKLGKPVGIAAGAIGIVLTAVLAFSMVAKEQDISDPTAPVTEPAPQAAPGIGAGEGSDEAGANEAGLGGAPGGGARTGATSGDSNAGTEEAAPRQEPPSTPSGGQQQRPPQEQTRPERTQPEPTPPPVSRPAPAAVVAQPTAKELDEVGGHIYLANLRVERNDWVGADSLIQAGLNQVGALLNQYPSVDTLAALRSALRSEQARHRSACQVVARVVSDVKCPGQ